MADNLTLLFAKMSGLYKTLKTLFNDDARQGFPQATYVEFYQRYSMLAHEMKVALPDLLSDLPYRELPKPTLTARDYETLLYSKAQMQQLLSDMEYIFEVRANSEMAFNLTSDANKERPDRVFISHGRSSDWMEVQAYIEKDLAISTLELAQEPNQGRTILQKLAEESDKCSFAVVVMTGDDAVDSDAPRVRENVMHEIGFFQGKYGLPSVCLLHEEGVSVPTNIHGVVYVPFPKSLVSASFGVMSRELRAFFKTKL